MKRLFGCLALLASGIAASASAEPPRPWSAEMTVGRQYDSNVTIDEIDRVSHVGDLATLAEAQGAWRLHPMRNTDLRLNYNLSYVLHDDFAAFNQQVQSVG
ncbi:MAG: hypothetical protein JF615_09255, partial [Asticcacaulis sp.]|nr:hypothetical protein [Asticcacaulis sp.]